ncbi:MAG TPA: Rrf2 family transcriptional regulator [Phycisphaerae bacterium]|nr:Rrf2 family transcriptional regulator [Phycisphaerae bacterium]
MISQTAEYALRAVVWLAGRPEDAAGTRQIARATCVPPGYLSKVLQGLRRARLVVSLAGRAGGFRLAREPAKITILEVVNAVDPLLRIRRCPIGLKGHARVLCPLHRRLDAAYALVEKVFAETRLSELVGTSDDSGPLCEFAPRRPRRSHARRR